MNQRPSNSTLTMSKQELVEILSSIPNDAQVNAASIDAIYKAYARGYENAHCGFDELSSRVYPAENHAPLRLAYDLGYKLGQL